ncbi:MAG: response regulator [Oculatellaceae cyanobacterium Prado106]|jgi:response regulator RpfG family c-di-GMP phosphodiesterase|nr:response regulator [Oculatellaceae cyanobacterium Prado106]
MAKRILLINDEQGDRNSAKAYFESFGGWEVMTSRSGYEGMGKAESTQPDAILLDVRDLKTDGMGMLNQLQANPSTQAIPVLLLTTAFHTQLCAQFAQRGVRGLTYTPYEPATLATDVAESLGWA